MLQKMVWTQTFCLLWPLSFHLAVIQLSGKKKKKGYFHNQQLWKLFCLRETLMEHV